MITKSITKPLDSLLLLAVKIKSKLDNNLPALTVVTGDPGTGKSTLVLQLASYFQWLSGKPWDWRKHTHYDGEPFVKSIHRMNDEYVMEIMNEGGESFHNYEWFSDIAKEMSKATMRARIFKKPYVVIIPFHRKLAVDLRAAADFRIQTYYHRGHRYARIWAGKRPVSAYHKYTEPFWEEQCHKYSFPPLPDKFQKEYDRFDIKAKDELANKYEGKKKAQAKKRNELIEKYTEVLKKRIVRGERITSSAQVFTKLRGEGITQDESREIWSQVKASPL